MISGKTTVIAHIGYPTEAFKAPLIYNPWFEKRGIDAVLVPMGVKVEDYPAVVMSLFKLTNIRGALVTMPHKVTTGRLVNEISTAVEVWMKVWPGNMSGSSLPQDKLTRLALARSSLRTARLSERGSLSRSLAF